MNCNSTRELQKVGYLSHDALMGTSPHIMILRSMVCKHVLYSIFFIIWYSIRDFSYTLGIGAIWGGGWLGGA